MSKRVLSLTGGALPLFAWRLPAEIANHKVAKMPAGQWIHVIKGFSSKGIKAAEIDDSKIIAWLEERGKEQITKETLAEAASFALPSIKEVTLSGNDARYRSYSWAGDGTSYNESVFYFPHGVEDYDDRIADMDDAIAALNFDFDRLGEDPDLVFRLDMKREELLAKRKAHVGGHSGGNIYTHFAETLQSICPDARADFAHMRWSALDIDGKKTLMVHEFQSDWAQKGRAEAQKNQERQMYRELQAHHGAMSEEDRELFARVNTDDWEQGEKAAMEPLYVKFVGPMPGAPEWTGTYKKAPLVTETEYWSTFLMRRAMQMAVENGCEQVTWINGINMVNGGHPTDMRDFYQKIVTGAAKRLAKPFKSELFLKEVMLKSASGRKEPSSHGLAFMPVTSEMKDSMMKRAAVYSHANVYADSTFDADKAKTLGRALQLRADRHFGQENVLFVSVVREILDAHRQDHAVGALLGNVTLVAFGAADPIAALDHEAFHFAFRHHLSPRDRATVRTQFAAGSPLLARTVSLLMGKGDDDAAEQASTNEEEAAAHGYALWNAGLLTVASLKKAGGGTKLTGAIDIINRVFPAATKFVLSACRWMRGQSASPTDFVARIIRAEEKAAENAAPAVAREVVLPHHLEAEDDFADEAIDASKPAEVYG